MESTPRSETPRSKSHGLRIRTQVLYWCDALVKRYGMSEEELFIAAAVTGAQIYRVYRPPGYGNAVLFKDVVAIVSNVERIRLSGEAREELKRNARMLEAWCGRRVSRRARLDSPARETIARQVHRLTEAINPQNMPLVHAYNIAKVRSCIGERK